MPLCKHTLAFSCSSAAVKCMCEASYLECRYSMAMASSYLVPGSACCLGLVCVYESKLMLSCACGMQAGVGAAYMLLSKRSHLEEGLFCTHPLHRTVCRLLWDNVLPPHILAFLEVDLFPLGCKHMVIHQHCLDGVPLRLHLLHCCVHNTLQNSTLHFKA